mgnify:CR=1 FL=1
MITSKTPKLDLHGEIVAMVEVLVNSFINDNILLKNEYIIIIHGKSTNILTGEVNKVLKNNKNVLEFRRNNWNLGETIVKLKI